MFKVPDSFVFSNYYLVSKRVPKGSWFRLTPFTLAS